MMNAQQQDALQALLHAGQPMSAGAVAATLGMRLIDAQDALGYLVRHGGARRHHCNDAVMRYSAIAKKRAARKPGMPHPPRRAPKADAVLAAIDAGLARARDIGAACRMSSTYTSVVLHRLEAQGLVCAKGHPRLAEWQRAEPPAPRDSALAPNLTRAVRTQPQEDDDELPPWLGERFRDITHDIQRAAFEAQQEVHDHD